MRYNTKMQELCLPVQLYADSAVDKTKKVHEMTTKRRFNLELISQNWFPELGANI